MIWPFRRKAQPKPKPRLIRATDEWRVGDLARCINGDWTPGDPSDPRPGDILRVAGVRHDGFVARANAIVETALTFCGKPAATAWSCTGFIKIVPKHEACDEAFAALIKSRQPAPAGSDTL